MPEKWINDRELIRDSYDFISITWGSRPVSDGHGAPHRWP